MPFDIMTLIPIIFSILACDQKFISTANQATKNGTFKAPSFLNPDKVKPHVPTYFYAFQTWEIFMLIQSLLNLWFLYQYESFCGLLYKLLLYFQHVTQCTYTFLALEDERIKLEFEDFDLDGTPPE